MTRLAPGLLLSCVLVAFAHGCAAASDPEHVFDTLWRDFDELYGPFASRNVDWDLAYERHRPKVQGSSSDDALFIAVTDLLAELDDGHVGLIAPGRPQFQSNRIRRELENHEAFDLEAIRAHLLLPGFRSGPMDEWTLGRLAKSAVYVHLAFIGPSASILDEALVEAEEAALPLVIDLRHNRGGDFRFAFSVLDDWVEERTEVFRSRTRNGPARDDFTSWTTWSLRGGGAAPAVPVFVLTDRYTISAGERTVLALRVVPGVVVVGEPTNGALSTLIGRELPNGWLYTVSVQVTTDAAGVDHEGRGIPVDAPALDDVATPTQDEVIDAALSNL